MSIFDPSTFTGIHSDLSVIALIAGVVVVIGLIRSRLLPLWTEVFLATAVLTSATGFGFQRSAIMPSHVIGAIALAVLLVAILALYVFRLAGAWRWIYAVSAVVSLFFLVFVAIAQAFAKVPALHALAPTQSEPPFGIAQGVNLVIFVVLGIAAVRLFHRHPAFASH
jgi:hypothetical protein